MKFRPCIDLHDGQVKQIVGSTLTDTTNKSSTRDGDDNMNNILQTNFATTKPAYEYAIMYGEDRLTGGHVIMLGPGNVHAAKDAIQIATKYIYPNECKLQIGGGITSSNAKEWIDYGASHVIITSYVFESGQIRYDRLNELITIIGKDKLVLDLSCRKKPKNYQIEQHQQQEEQQEQDQEGNDTTTAISANTNDNDNHNDNLYYVVTDRWQKFTNVPITSETLHQLSNYCSEFLIHGVDVEGKQCGILEDLVELLGNTCPIPVTYAGGIRSIQDLELVERIGKGKVDCTVGSALDIFGGTLPYKDVVLWHNQRNGV